MTDLEKIRTANRERNTAIVLAYRECDIVQPGEDAPHKRLSAALLVVAGQFRARGEEMKAAKRKGHVSTKAALDFAAEQAEDVAASLANDGWKSNGGEWARAASEVAGVAVSLNRDGVNAEIRAVATALLSAGGIVDGGAPDVELCGELGPWDSRCARPAGHADYHIGADGNGFDAVPGQSDAPPPWRPGNSGQRCPSQFALTLNNYAQCILIAGHEGAHSDGDGEWVAAEAPTALFPGATAEVLAPIAAEAYAGQCESADVVSKTRCMLTGGHTGIHIDAKGGRWPQTAQETTDRIAVEAKAIVAELKSNEPIRPVPTLTVSGIGFAAPITVPLDQDTYDVVSAEVLGPMSLAVDWKFTPPSSPRGSSQAWPERRQREFTPGCEHCDFDTHLCRGCGTPTTHGQGLDCGRHDRADVRTISEIREGAVGMNMNGPGPIRFMSASPAPIQLIAAQAAPVLAPFEPPVNVDPKTYQSVSSINTMAECGLKYRFTYRDKLPETPAWWSVGGRALHSYMERVERVLHGMPHKTALKVLDSMAATAAANVGDLLTQEISDTEGKAGALPDTWRAASKGSEGYAWWANNAPDMAVRYLAHRARWGEDFTVATLPNGGPAVEVEFMTDFGGVPVKGFIDRVSIRRADGLLVVEDNKSGSRAPSDSFQLGVYGHSLAAAGLDPGESNVLGSYYMARKGEDRPRPVPVTQEWSREAIAYRAQTTVAADRADLFIARPSEFCASCPFRRQCPVINGGAE